MEYQIIKSSRKTIAIEVTKEGSVVVRIPFHCPISTVNQFLERKKIWIDRKVRERKAKSRVTAGPAFSSEEKDRFMEQAKKVFEEKALFYAHVMGVYYQRITVREQKTRWGSCSSKRNLNFNWRLLLAPEQVLDYVVIHELAHLIEMNHSSDFYAVVASVMPDFKVWQRWLKENGALLWERA